MEIDNKATAADRLLSVSSTPPSASSCATVETKDGVAKMRQVEGGIALPAGGEVKLAPGGYHVMFLKLKALRRRPAVPATLKFEKAGEVAVQFKVKPAAHSPGMSHDHSSMKH